MVIVGDGAEIIEYRKKYFKKLIKKNRHAISVIFQKPIKHLKKENAFVSIK